MSNPERKTSIFHTMHVIASLALLIWAISLYIQHKNTIPGLSGFAILIIFTILPFMIRIITAFFMLITILSLLAAGYAYWKYFSKPDGSAKKVSEQIVNQIKANPL